MNPDADREGALTPIHTWMIQISILANHQNGKDTHVRSCLVWGPREAEMESEEADARPMGMAGGGTSDIFAGLR